MKCEKCNREFLSQRGLIYHLTSFKNVNPECYQYYIDKYNTENNFPWKQKKTEFKMCECCLKEFKREFALQMHLMTGKKYSSGCYQFYIDKYKTEDNFPTRRYSESQLKDFQTCECCSKKFKQVIMHLRKYSPSCYQFYINKYQTENNFPDEIKPAKTGICPDCGKPTASVKSKWCIDCYRHNHHTIAPDIVDEMQKKLKVIHSNPEYIEKVSKIHKQYSLDHPEKAENQRQYMLRGGAIKALVGNTNCSKPQVEFFNLVKVIKPDAVLNYPIYDINVLLDIAVPSLKIDLEYDGSYWHQDDKFDSERDDKIKSKGWKIYRFRDRIPTEEEIRNIILENQGVI
jgi:hypothetical protein